MYVLTIKGGQFGLEAAVKRLAHDFLACWLCSWHFGDEVCSSRLLAAWRGGRQKTAGWAVFAHGDG